MTSRALLPPRKVFKKAVERDAENGTAKLSRFKDTYGIEDVLEIVGVAKDKYETQKVGSKLRERLATVSSRVTYYGQILDVLSQHHPEYVSLAWGTMKFLFLVKYTQRKMSLEAEKAE